MFYKGRVSHNSRVDPRTGGNIQRGCIASYQGDGYLPGYGGKNRDGQNNKTDCAIGVVTVEAAGTTD